MVVVMDYGILVDEPQLEYFDALVDTHFRNTDFGYMTIRVNSYSVNPHVYKTIGKWKNLKCFAIVDIEAKAEKTFPVESAFFKGPMHLFQDVKKAYKWVLELTDPAKTI
jgi:hypothetical protein